MVSTLLVLFGCQPSPWESQRIFSAEQHLFEAQESWQADRVEEAYQNVELALSTGGLAPDQYIDANVLKLECLLKLHRFEEAGVLLSWLEVHAMDAPELNRFRHRLNERAGPSPSLGTTP